MGSRTPLTGRRGGSTGRWPSTCGSPTVSTTAGWNAGLIGTLTLVERAVVPGGQSRRRGCRRSTATIDAVWAHARHRLDRRRGAQVPHQRDRDGPGRSGGTRRSTCWPRSPTRCVRRERARTRGPRTRSRSTSTPATPRTDAYRFDDTQIRISADERGVVRHRRRGVPAGPAAERDGPRPPTGYAVEAAISLLEYGGAGHVPRPGLPGQRRLERRQDVDPELGRADRARLPVHGPWGVAKLVETDARARIADVIASLRGACIRSNAGPEAIGELEQALLSPPGPTGPTCTTTGAAVFDHFRRGERPSSTSVLCSLRTRTPWRRRPRTSSRFGLLALIAVEPLQRRGIATGLDPLRRSRRVRRGGDVRQRRQALREGLGSGHVTAQAPGPNQRRYVDEKGGGTQR